MKRVEAFGMGQGVPSNGTYLFNKEATDPNTGKNRLYIFYEVPVRTREGKTDTSKATIDAVIDHLNKVTGGNYSRQTKLTRDKIRIWVNGGKTFDQFKKVIDVKSAEWLDNPEMRKFLRPQTLFGPKFEGYLNSVPADEVANAPFNELERLMDGIGDDDETNNND